MWLICDGKSSMRRKSVGPKKSITACTESDSSLLSGVAKAGSPALAPARAARCPPEEVPQMATRRGSRLYCCALARIKRIAAFTSWAWAGARASREWRYSTLAIT